MLGGEPGAGKSHITEDVMQLAVRDGRAILFIACHINGGSPKGRIFTQEAVDTAKDVGEEAIVIFDNLDYAVYTGGLKRRRSNRQTSDYCNFITTVALECADSGCGVFATTHTDEWRRNHSQAPRAVFHQFETAVEKLGGIENFEGKISLANTIRLLVRRGVATATAQEIALQLHELDSLCFRSAYHIDPTIVGRQGARSALQKVNELKNKKMQGGA